MSPLILVIDDDELVRANLQVVLTLEGYSVITADGAKRGLQIVEEALPDLVVLDISMPEMDGWEALSRMREDSHGADLPVLALTGDNRDPGEFRRAGFNAYLSKGGALEHFLCTVRSALGVSEGRGRIWLHSCNGKRCLVSRAWEEEASLERSSG